MSSLPLNRRCIVRSGMTTVSSRSCPKFLCPYDCSSPIKLQDSERRRSRLPIGSTSQISSYFGQLRKEPATLSLSATDAAARGIANGDTIRIWNDQGEVRAFARITTDLQPGVCLMPKGLWRKHSRNGFTSNALIPATFADLAGQAAWNDTRVQVAKD